MIIPHRHIANTRTKKEIKVYDTAEFEYIKAQTTDYIPGDSFDAYCAFEYASIRSIRLYGAHSDEQKIMEAMISFHRRRMSETFFDEEKKSLLLMTSIDIRNYGESLCTPSFREIRYQ